MAPKNILVVGAGLCGCVMAERLARRGCSVQVVERRPHLAGNAHDALDAAGVMIHTYGPHIFHTNLPAVADHLAGFTTLRPYQHRVLARVHGRLYPLPINRTTLASFFGVELPDAAAAAGLLGRIRQARQPVLTSEDAVLDAVGPELYQAFFRGYTRKQWGLDPRDLDASVCARIPVRTGDDDRYFTDEIQGLPQHGFTALCARLVDHPAIRVSLRTPYEPAMRETVDHLVWTGPIDQFFGYCFGHLPYLGLEFRHEHLPDRDRFQEVGVINECDEEVPYTRTTEFKHLTGQVHPGTSICREFPHRGIGAEPAYPVPNAANRALYLRYRAEADRTPRVTFVGRLAEYRYLNMDLVIASALAAADALAG
jgi:UDP-galactopyranose mutase